MTFELTDRWMWDLWIAEESGVYHLFFLQAPRSLGNPGLRHRNATVGHAISTDLTDWTEVATALEPGLPGEFDDIATWTGSVLKHDGCWWMFYTGAAHRDDALVQRIGAATSKDLVTWEKHVHNPLIEADPRWYELLDLSKWHDQAWRDPWVYPVDGGFEMLVTARSNRGLAPERGVIGRAFSKDLSSWTVRPPLTDLGGFGHMEVPQRVAIGGRDFLFFSCPFRFLAPSRAAAGTPRSGCYVLEFDGSGAPYPAVGAVDLDVPNVYSVRPVQDPTGRWVLIGFEVDDGEGGFAGRISDPIPLEHAAPGLFGPMS